jgi:pimeloyl-ACP methyl ester carboxylesterase
MRKVLGDHGPAVLLLPGGAEAVEGFFPGLAEGLIADPGCRVVLYDRAGTGASDVEGSIRDAADDLHALITDLGLGPVVAIGQSLGGAAALLLATQHPDDVSGLVLLDPTPVNDPELARTVVARATSMARFARFSLVHRAMTAMLVASVGRSARRHGMSEAARRAGLAVAEVDIPGLARAVDGLVDAADGFDASTLPRVPAAVVTADRKPGDPVRRAHERLAGDLGATATMWPRAEHAVHLTHEAEVIALSREIVRRVAAADEPR